MTRAGLPSTESNLLSLLEDWPFRVGDLLRTAERPLSAYGHRNFPIDVIEEGGSYVIEASLPGVVREDIDVSMEENSLTIQVKQAERAEKNGKNYLHRERCVGPCSRTVSLPFTSGDNEVEAVLKDGVLRLVVQKTPEKQIKKIDIH
jgi:HSP20 family protein